MIKVGYMFKVAVRRQERKNNSEVFVFHDYFNVIVEERDFSLVQEKVMEVVNSKKEVDIGDGKSIKEFSYNNILAIEYQRCVYL